MRQMKDKCKTNGIFHLWDMTHSYVWTLEDRYVRQVAWDPRNLSFVGHDSQMKSSFAGHDSFLCVDTSAHQKICETCLLMCPRIEYQRVSAHQKILHIWISSISGTWLISMCEHIGTSEDTWDMSSHVSTHRISTRLGTLEDTAHQDILH